MAETTSSRRWSSRPWLARLVRAVVVVAPIVASIGAVIVGARLFPRPPGFVPTALWWIGLTLVSTTVLWGFDRVFRRLLPIAALFRLSLVFPDRAPSRFTTALRSGTLRQLKRRLAEGGGRAETPQEAAEQLIALASALNDHDRLTRGHTERVRAYSVMIGEELGLDEADLELLNWSGLVHDIGKLTVPTEILSKPGKPTPDEWAILRDHPANADELIAPLRPWLGQWAESATQHHERFDGTGYPAGLAGHDITLAGRIVAVADAYDVMTSTRSYKKPMAADEARRELAVNAGTQFDPDAVRAFLNISLGRLRLVMGPLSSLIQLPAGGASLGSTAATGVGAIASVAVAAVAGVGSVAPPPETAAEPMPDIAAFRVVEVDDSSIDLDEDSVAVVDLGLLATGDIDSITIVERPEGGTIDFDGRTLRFTPEADWHGVAEVRFRVCFVGWGCETGTVRFVIGPANDQPTPWMDRGTTAEDTPVTVDVVANDVDIDGDTLELVSATVLDEVGRDLGPASVSVSVVDGGVLVEPGADRWGTAVVAYEVTDGIESATGRLLVEVTPVNDAPTAVTDTVVAYENTTTEFDVLTNDVDVDGDAITIVSIEGVTGGSAVANGETVTFVPDVRYVGPAGLTYTITDGELIDRAEVDITVRAVSDRPALVDDAVTGFEDQPVTVDVLANDAAYSTAPAPSSSSSGVSATIDRSTVTVVAQPDHGTVTWDGATFTYVPDPNRAGQDRFRYGVCTTDQFCAIASVEVTVSAVNDAPSFVGGVDVLVGEDAGAVVVPGWVGSMSAGPADEAGQVLAFGVSVDDPSLFAVGPVVDVVSGALSFTPAGDANGSAVVSVVLSDDGGTVSGGVDASAPVTHTITVAPANDAPVAVDDTATVAEDTVAGITFDVLANDTDVDGDTLVVDSVDTSGVTDGGITDHLDGTFTYVPDDDFTGTETLLYTVGDGSGATDSGQVTITVTPVADQPVAEDDARVTPVDTPLVVTAPGLLTNDYDVDGDSLTVVTTPVTPPSNGGVALGADGSYTYTPSGGFVGTDTFVYEVSDPGGLTTTATVTVTVDSGVSFSTFYLGDSGASIDNYDLVTSVPVSSSPVFDADGDGDPGLTIVENRVLSSDTDEYQLWTWTAATPLALDGPVTFDLWSAFTSFDTGETGHPYVWLFDCATGGVSCTQLASTDVHTNDWDQGIADFVGWQLDLGSVTHTVPAGRELVLRLQFDHEDMWVAMTADYPSALDLTLANVAPTAVDDTATVDEDSGTTTLSVLGNDTDADLDATSVSVTVAATAGTAAAQPDGTIDYTPDPDANGGDVFTYQVCDLGGLCDTATVSVTVNPINDQPSFTSGSGGLVGTVGANTVPGWATAMSAGPADESGQILSFVFTSNDNAAMFSAGPAIDPGTGDLTYTTTGSGTANLIVVLTDDGGTAGGGVDTSTVSAITITVP